MNWFMGLLRNEGVVLLLLIKNEGAGVDLGFSGVCIVWKWCIILSYTGAVHME